MSVASRSSAIAWHSPSHSRQKQPLSRLCASWILGTVARAASLPRAIFSLPEPNQEANGADLGPRVASPSPGSLTLLLRAGRRRKTRSSSEKERGHRWATLTAAASEGHPRGRRWQPAQRGSYLSNPPTLSQSAPRRRLRPSRVPRNWLKCAVLPHCRQIAVSTVRSALGRSLASHS